MNIYSGVVVQGMQILVQKKSDQAGVQQFTSLVDTAVYTRYAPFCNIDCSLHHTSNPHPADLTLLMYLLVEGTVNSNALFSQEMEC